ncbi:glycosyl hydrolase family 28 protein [Cohnella soli]|uniref:Glycosyl hydrolase family 28 protein n=1 Tax=Cohnella soli TaxID=425005 RepID=A0ABW0HSB9_9BACL
MSNNTIKDTGTASTDYQVRVNGHPVHVYRTSVHFEDDRLEKERCEPEMASFCYFPMTEDQAVVEVEVLFGAPDDVSIRPLSRAIRWDIRERTIRFVLDSPVKLSVEIGRLIHRNLMIFAEQPEREPISAPAASGAENLIYFGPGVHTIAGEYGILELKSRQTLYLAAGAVLRGRIFAEDAHDIVIRGAGILEGTCLKGRWPDYLQSHFGEERGTERPAFVELRNCVNVTIRGIKLIDSPSWTVYLSGCEQVLIEDIKLIGYVPNSDGINPVDSRDVTIRDVFIRTGDDCVAVKANAGRANTVVERITVSDSVFWADRASAIEIGHETTAAAIQDVIFENLDILHQDMEITGYHAIDIANCDQAAVRRITYRDIRVERARRLIGVRVNGGIFAKSPERGHCADIVFDNIVCGEEAPFDIHLYGYDEEHQVEGIVIRNLKHSGDPERKPQLYANPFVRNVVVDHKGHIRHADRLYPDDIRTLQPGLAQRELEVGGIRFECPSILPSEPVAGIPFEAGILHDRFDIGAGVNAETIFFLHTVAGLYARIGVVLAAYIVEYESGEDAIVPVVSRLDADDWKLWSMAGWQAVRDGVRLYVQAWRNPEPGRRIRAIRLERSEAGKHLIWLGVSYGI